MCTREKLMHALEVAVFVCIAATVHLYGISRIPNGINVDEMGMGYDAWCMAHFGVDRYLKSYPVYLTNFGGGQSALYAYLCMPLVKIFGLSVITLRLPGILLYLIAACVAGKVFLLSGKQGAKKARLCSFLLIVLPVFILLFRIGMDCNLMLAMSIIFLYLITKAVKTGSVRDYVFAGLAGGSVLYTYVLSYVVMPFFLLFFLSYLIYIRKIRFRQVVALGIPMAVLAMPLILVQLVNMFDLQEFKIGAFTITKLLHYRIGEISMENFSLQSVLQSIKSILMYDRLRYNTIPRFGTIFYISIPFVVIGLGKSLAAFCVSIKNKEFCIETVYLTWFMMLFLLGCFIDANTNKLNAAFAAVLFLLVEGIFQVTEWFGRVHLGRQAMMVIIGIYVVMFAAFLWYYFGGQYMRDYDKLDFFEYPLNDAIEYVDQSALCQDMPTYIGDISQTYIYYLGATQISPYEYDMESSLNGAGAHENFIMGFPKQTEWNANYIISNNDVENCQYFEDLGFLKIPLEHYNIYTFQLDSYKKIEKDAWPMALGWDRGVLGQGQIMLQESRQTVDGADRVSLVGWSYNQEMMCPWTSVYIRIGGCDYHAARAERPDVAEVFENEALVDSGILFDIPAEALEQGQEIVLYCIDAQNRMYQQVHMELAD